MKLTKDDRLQACAPENDANAAVKKVAERNRALYIVGDLIFENPYFAYYTGYKVFRNAHKSTGLIQEANLDESLRVILKVIKYVDLSDRASIQSRRKNLIAEAKKILSIKATNLLPEPIDLLFIPNNHDKFLCSRSKDLIDQEPVLVQEAISGTDINAWITLKNRSIFDCLLIGFEILRFAEVLHSNGFFVHSIYPNAFRIDEHNRLHFFASDTVLESNASPKLICDRIPSEWCDRPTMQCFDKCDSRIDVYGWGLLIYYLITGGKQYNARASIGIPDDVVATGYRDIFQKSLQKLSTGDEIHVAKILGIDHDRIRERFKENLTSVVFSCLDRRINFRPGGASVIKSWIEKPPPQHLSFAVVLRNSNQLYALTATECNGARSVCVCENLDFSPTTRDAGTSVFEGLAGQSAICLNRKKKTWTGRERFSIFTFDDDGSGNRNYSIAVDMPVVDLGNPVKAMEVMNSQVGEISSENGYFWLRKALIAARDFPLRTDLNELLLKSDSIAHRKLAIDLITNAFKEGWSNNTDLIHLRDIALHDSNIYARINAANVILQHSYVNESLLNEIADCVGMGNKRLCLRVLESLHLVDYNLIVRVKQKIGRGEFEGCPECNASIPIEEIDDHLVKEHAYVIDRFACLPLRHALSQWWERFLFDNDTDASKCLTQRLNTNERRGLALCAQVERIWLPNFIKLDERRRSTERERIKRLLSGPDWINASRYLIQSQIQLCKDLGREILIPKYALHFNSSESTLDSFLKVVRFIAGSDSHESCTFVVKELSKHGALNSLVGKALSELDRTRKVVCSLCSEEIGNHLLSKHKRLSHNLYEYQGRRTSLEDFLKLHIVALFGKDPQLSDIDQFIEVASEQFQGNEVVRMFMRNFKELVELNRESWNDNRSNLIGSIIAQCSIGHEISIVLLRDEDKLINEIGLNAVVHSTNEFDKSMVDALADVMARPGHSKNLLRQLVEKALLRMKPASRDQLLRAYIKHESDRLEQLQLLQSLKESVGALWEIGLICSELEDLMRVRCPVCDGVFTGKEIGPHVETSHGRIWEGRSVRPAWNMAIETMIEYSDSPSSVLLEKAEHYALISGGPSAVDRLRRIACSKGWADGVYLPFLRNEASKNEVSLCPKCYGDVVATPSPEVMSISICNNSVKSEFASVSATHYFPLTFINLIASESGAVDTDEYIRIPTSYGYFFLGFVVFISCLLVRFTIQLGSIWGFILFGLLSVFVLVSFLFLRSIRFSGLPDLIDLLWNDLIEERLKKKPSRPFESFLMGLVSHPKIATDRRISMLEEIEPYLWRHNSGNVFQEKTVSFLLQLKLQTAIGNADYELAFELINRLVINWIGGFATANSVESITLNGRWVEALSEQRRRHLAWSLIRTSFASGLGPDDLMVLKERNHLCRIILDSKFSPNLTTLRMAKAMFDGEQQAISLSGGNSIFQALRESFGKSINPFEHLTDLLFYLPDGSLIAREKGLYWGHAFLSHDTVIQVTRSFRQFIQTGWLHQRLDGGPDMRFNYNPPVGYWTEDGWYIIIGKSKPFLMRSDPAEIMSCIEQWKLVHMRLQKAANSPTPRNPDRVNHLLKSEPLYTCSECGTKQTFVLGGVGRVVA